MAEPDDLPSRAEQRRRTEARILAAASSLFVEAGYERTTIRGIARAAGVDAGLVSAVILDVVVSRHLLESGGLTGADPEQIIDLLRPGLRSLTRADQDRR